MNKIILLTLPLLLFGCKVDGNGNTQMYTEREYQYDGCTIKWIYNPDNYNFYIAKCSGSETTTMGHHTGGKTNVPITTISSTNVEEMQKQLDNAKTLAKLMQKLTPEEQMLLGIKQ